MPEWLLALAVAAVSVTGTLIASRYGRVATLERRLAAIESRERLMWLYNRELIDHIYRGHGPPPPAPPNGVYGEEEL